MTLLLTSILCFFFGCAVGACAKYLNQESKGYSRLPSFEEAKEMTESNVNQQELKGIAESTDPCDPDAYLIRHYRNGDGSTDAWVVCLREYTSNDVRVTNFNADPYHEFEVRDYEEYDLPDFGGFKFIYVNEDDDDPKRNTVGFMERESAGIIKNIIVEMNKKNTFSLVEEYNG